MHRNHTVNSVGVATLHRHFDGLIASTSANAYWKDESGKYLGANSWQMQRFGMDLHQCILGATDNDFLSCDNASLVMQNDKRVTTNKQALIIVEPLELLRQSDTSGETSLYLSYKSPLLNQLGKVIGVFGLSYLLNNQYNNEVIFHELGLIGGHHASDIAKNIISQSKKSESKLTDRQSDCLRLLAKGMTMKQIAECLSLSARTVEHYLDTVKVKLNCTSKSELINKAIELGLFINGWSNK